MVKKSSETSRKEFVDAEMKKILKKDKAVLTRLAKY